MKRDTIIYLLIIFVITSEFSLILSPAIAITETKSIIASEDATINAHEPITNYGGYPLLRVSYGWDWYEAFIKFDLSNAPKEFSKVELKFEITYMLHPGSLEIYETNINWSESTITWDNAPQNRIIITNGTIYDYRVYSFEITGILGLDQDSCSICLSSDTADHVHIESRECSSDYSPPRIIFYFDIDILPTIFSSIIAGIVVACIFGLILNKIYYKKPKLKEEKI